MHLRIYRKTFGDIKLEIEVIIIKTKTKYTTTETLLLSQKKKILRNIKKALFWFFFSVQLTFNFDKFE